MIPIVSIVAFFRGPLGKVAAGVLLAVFLFASFQVWLHNHDANIRTAALEEFNQQQVLEVKRAKEAFDRAMERVLADQEAALAKLTAERNRLEKQAKMLIQELADGNFAGATTESSEVLKRTIQLLQNRANGE